MNNTAWSNTAQRKRNRAHAKPTRVGVGVLSLIMLASPVSAAGMEALEQDLTQERMPRTRALNALKQPNGIKKIKRALRLQKDFYYFKGQRVPLARSLDEVVIQFKARMAPQREEEVVKDYTLSGKSMGTVNLPSGAYSIYSLEEKQFTAEQDLASFMGALESHADIGFVSPVFVNEETGTKMTLTPEVVAKLKPDRTPDELQSASASIGLVIERHVRGTTAQFVLRVGDPKATSPLEAANALHESGVVEWAEPNFIQEYQLFSAPDDPLYPFQWHLDNTGQGGGIPGASVDAVAAWDLETGSSTITIAVLDDGMQLNHPDLAPNLFINPHEIPDNGIDDDGNGFVDDVHGWDFANQDDDPNPHLTSGGFGPDSHGTAVAGVAAAKGHNALGVTGMCQDCKILPVKIANNPGSGQNLVNFSNEQAAESIRYAASLADVLNNSWGGGAPSNVIQEAIRFATTEGRNGKGAVVIFAAGNSANGASLRGLNVPAGTHRIMWEYSKDANGQFAGDDTAWISWVRFPDGEVVHFDKETLPDGWATYGAAGWRIVNDVVHADEGRCVVNPVKAGEIGPNQSSVLEVIKTVPEGPLSFYAWISSELNSDGVRLLIDYNNDGTIDFTSVLLSGVPLTNQNVAYPAAFPEAIAVGASSNFDCRSGYSEFGSELDFVAPSSGGPLNLRITTTDLVGVAGFDPADYLPNDPASTGFGGTSSAAPLVSGVAGLMLSRNPMLTADEVRQILKDTADQIGPDPYIGGRNDRYGHGRVNAFRALQASTPSVEVAAPELIEPMPGSTLPGAEVVFSWSRGVGIDGYRLTIGSTSGGIDIFDSQDMTATSISVSNIPVDGRLLFVRLFYQANGQWQFTEHTYLAAKRQQVVTADALAGFWWQPTGRQCIGSHCADVGFIYAFSPTHCVGDWCGGSRQGWSNRGEGWRPTSSQDPFAWRIQDNWLVLFFWSGYRIEVFQITDHDPATGKLSLRSRDDPNTMFFKLR